VPSVKTLRKLLPLTVLALIGTGCQHSASASPPAEATAQLPAPFAAPPVLAGTPDIATLVAKVKPAVVNITTVQEVKVAQGPDLSDVFPFFHQGPGARPRRPQGDGEGEGVMKQQALGSGFIVDALGHVVTNAHVVEGATRVKVRLSDDRELTAKVIGKDERLDVAVLQLDNTPRDLPVASLGRSEPMRVGDYVVAIGNPFGLGNTVTMGIVSAKGRSIGAGPYDDFIQTDASINPGNSGGPLFNLYGQVIGINTAINPNGKGIGFAIPVDAIKQVLPELVATGHVSRGRLGVVIQGMDEDLAKALGMDRPHGALVEDVEPGSPAASAGLAQGDVILSVDGTPVAHSEELPRLVALHHPGTQVKLGILHDRKTRDVSVTLVAIQDRAASGDGAVTGSPTESSTGASGLGIGVTEADGQVVVERVLPDGPADGKLRRGDVIEEIDHQPVTSAAVLAAKVRAAAADKPVLLRVKHGEQSRFVAIERR
jgi:serine protease Do